MSMSLADGDFVYIKAGDEAGSWGIVRLVTGTEYHVAVAAGSDVRVYERYELSRPRDQTAHRGAPLTNAKSWCRMGA
jgi:ribosomal protein L24